MSGELALALEIIEGVNTLFTLAAKAGVSYAELEQQMRVAAAEGRPFDLEDLQVLVNRRRKSADRLDQAIAEARARAKG